MGAEEKPVTDPWIPTLEDITKALTEISDRVADSTAPVLDTYVEHAIRDLTHHLELHIPGLFAPPDPETAEALARSAQLALDRGDERQALVRALRGLCFAPHDPRLFYIASGACFEFGSVELALRLLYHTLWIHPGHLPARADLESLSAFLDGGEDDHERAA